MSFVFLGMLVGGLVRFTVARPGAEASIIRALVDALRRHLLLVFVVAIILFAGFVAFVEAPLSSATFRFGLISWNVVTSAPAIAFAVLIGYLTTDFVIHHRRTDKTLAVAAILGAGALVLFLSQVFPGAEIKRVLASLDTPIAKFNFAQAQQPSSVRGVLTNSQQGSGGDFARMDSASSATKNIIDLKGRLDWLEFVAREITDDQKIIRVPNSSPTPYLNVYNNAILPMARCAKLIRSAAFNEDPEFLISDEFASKTRKILQLSYLNENQLSEYYDKFIEIANEQYFLDLIEESSNIYSVYNIFRETGRFDNLLADEEYHKTCKSLYNKIFTFVSGVGDASHSGSLSERSGIAAGFRDAHRHGVHFPMIVASMLALRGLQSDAADELIFWTHQARLDSERPFPPHYDEGEHPQHAGSGREAWHAHRRLSMVYALNWAAIFNDFDENPTREILAARESIRELDLLAGDHTKFRKLLDGAMTRDQRPFGLDGECSYGAPTYYSSDREIRFRNGFSLILRMYASNINNYIYWSILRPDLYTETEKDLIENVFLSKILRFDFDCMFSDNKKYNQAIALYFADTYVAARMAEAQALPDSSAESPTILRIACDLAQVRDAIKTLTDDFRETLEAASAIESDDVAMGTYVARERARRDANDILYTGLNNVNSIDHLFALVSGNRNPAPEFSDVSFRRNYASTCS